MRAGFSVYPTLLLYNTAQSSEKTSDVIDNLPSWASVHTDKPPCHLALSSDNLTLAVVIEKCGFPFALMYDVRAFADKVSDFDFVKTPCIFKTQLSSR